MKKVYEAFNPVKVPSWYTVCVLCLYDSSKKIKVREIQDQALDLALDFFQKEKFCNNFETLSLYAKILQQKQDFLQERRGLFAQELVESMLVKNFDWLTLTKSVLIQRLGTADVQIFLNNLY